MMNHRHRSTFALCLLLAAMPACRFPRDDDALEPNNAPSEATLLKLDQPVEARANEGDPDVFAVVIDHSGTLRFVIEHRGLENCAAFTVTGPDGDDLYRDAPFRGKRMKAPDVQADGAELTRAGDGYDLTVTAGSPGRYLLKIDEQPAADNIFAFSWDYRVTAKLN